MTKKKKEQRIKHLGENIKYIRENILHMTQKEYAAEVHLSKNQISKLEQGASAGSTANLLFIAEHAEVPLDVLLKDDNRISKLYAILFLLQSIHRIDSTLIDDTLHNLFDVYQTACSAEQPSAVIPPSEYQQKSPLQ